MASHGRLLLLFVLGFKAWTGVAGWMVVPKLSVSHHRIHGTTKTVMQWPSQKTASTRSTIICLSDSENNEKRQRPKQQPPKRREFTLKDLREEITRNPSGYLKPASQSKKYKRTRKRVENPKQTYLYASQRLALQQENAEDTDVEKTEKKKVVVATPQVMDHPDIILARQLGMISWQQHGDVEFDNMEPTIMGKIRVDYDDDDDDGDNDSANDGDDDEPTKKYTDSMAYIINKPAGWCISGSRSPALSTTTTLSTQNFVSKQKDKLVNLPEDVTSQRKGSERTTAFPPDDDDVPEYNEMDLLAVMTPKEKAEYKAEVGRVSVKRTRNTNQMDFYDGDGDAMSTKGMFGTNEQADDADDDDNDDDEDDNEYDESDLLAVMTPEERAEYEEETSEINPTQDTKKSDNAGMDELQSHSSKSPTSSPRRQNSEQTTMNLRRIAARISAAKNRNAKKASFAKPSLPSVLSWLRTFQASQGSPIRGNKYWVALVGATDIDDSGLVLLCPKSKVSNLFIDYTDYIAVVGNGGHLAPRASDPNASKGTTTAEVVSRLKKGRGDDDVTTVKVVVQERVSTCSDMVQVCQTEYGDGVRGDGSANPLDRRAPRRLLHCNAITVSNLSADDDDDDDNNKSAHAHTNTLPDDIAVLANRKQHVFTQGSFLGRSTLRANPSTTAYREINGEGDGFPGWTVDRYDKWLLVQHDTSQIRGPLPSIHDGNTAGVYYRSVGSSSRNAMPGNSHRLLEGKAAPAIIPVLENDITYHVSLENELSTIFLDQRPLRAWLSRHCHADTRVLNCFAGQGGGALSVAAAVAGASTVSLDLNQKWLDCIPSQLQANGIDFDERHDCIFGDCLDWLARLKKRGEKFDLVIIDPPNTFIGKKMTRWSVKDDMEELVALAAPLVKPNGLLWTCTRSTALPTHKFAKMCYQGLDLAGLANSKLERTQPVPSDFPTIGSQPVKYLMWRIPK